MKHLKKYNLYNSNRLLENTNHTNAKDLWFKSIDDYDIHTIETLIDSGFDVNTKDDNGYSALINAICNDYYDDRLVKLLLKQPNIQTNYALLTAARHCHEEGTILALLEYPKIQISLTEDGEEENFIQLLYNNFVDNEKDLSFLINCDLQKTLINNKRIDIIKLLDEYDLIDPEIKKEYPHLFTGTELNLL